MLKPHRRKPDQPKTAIPVVYGPANGELRSCTLVAQRMQILEGMAGKLADHYVWRAPITLEMQTCGSPNARWDFRNRKVIVCDQLADEFSELYNLYGRTMAFSSGEKASAPTPRGAYKQGRRAFRAGARAAMRQALCTLEWQAGTLEQTAWEQGARSLKKGVMRPR